MSKIISFEVWIVLKFAVSCIPLISVVNVCVMQNKVDAKNAEHEAEKRAEKERQEKAIGLLTYLGQGSVELDGGLACSYEFIMCCL